jgi:biotin operon repressor
MSFQAMTWATEQELPAMQKIVLLMMANRTNHETGLCYPSLDLLSVECGMTRRSVIQQIKRLEDDGLVEVIRYKNEKLVNAPNKYRLMLGKKAVRKFSGVVNDIHQGSECSSLGSECSSLGVVNVVHQGSESRSPEPGIEPVTLEPGKEPIKHSVEQGEKKPKRESLTDFAKQVFEQWKTIMGHDKAVLDKKRLDRICNMLKSGYSTDDLITAIKGCAKTPHNMGVNDRKQRYDSIDLIFRSADQVDRFISNFKTLPAIRPINSGQEVAVKPRPRPEDVKASRERSKAAFMANRQKLFVPL